jgi:hypothetical protein
MNNHQMKLSFSLSIILIIVTNAAFAQSVFLFDEPVKLSAQVNSDAEESMPLVANNGNTLFFVRTLHDDNQGGKTDQDIWQSDKNNDKWGAASNSISSLNNKFTNGIVGISNDGNTIYLLNSYKLKSVDQKGMSKSTKKNGKWSKPEMVDVPGLFFNENFYGFYVTPKEDILLVSMNKNGGKGLEDLYVSLKDKGGNWKEPINLGSSINTTGFEISPFLDVDDKTLYFASSEHNASGKSDIFKTVRLDDTWKNWSEPENMGAPVNSDGFDAFFTIYPDSTVYFASNRNGKLSDIYMSKILPPEIIIEPIDTVIPIIDIPLITVNDFTEFFGYNSIKIKENNGSFTELIANIKSLIAQNNLVEISIEGSASNVPTKTFSSNRKLAQHRADDARTKLELAFKANNIDGEKVIFSSTKAVVGGPKYKGDFKNTSAYQPHQFVRISVK